MIERRKLTPRPLLTYMELPSVGIDYDRATLRRLCAEGRFPRPAALSPRRLVWRRAEIEAWLAEKFEQRDNAARQDQDAAA